MAASGQVRVLAAGFLVFAIYLTLFFNLGGMAFVGADEPRYARAAEEMLESGDWVTPRLEGEAWLEKPPLLYWMAACSYRVFGVGEWAARLPNALAGALAALAVGGLGYFVAGTRAGLFSTLILCCSPLYVGLARSASMDAPLAASLTLALAAGFMAAERKGLLWAALSGACLGLAALAKGPVALVLFAGIFAAYFLWRDKLEWSAGQIALAGGVFVAVAAPWYVLVWRANGYDFVLTFWINHHIARFISDIHHHSQPFWFYLPVLLFGFFPWFFFLAPALVQLWQRRKSLVDLPDRGEAFVWIWAAAPLVFFSASAGKLAGYILPSIPALALIVGLLFDRYAAMELAVYRSVKRAFRWAVGFALILIAALPILGRHFYDSAQLGWALAVPLILGLGALGFIAGRRQPALRFLALAGMMTLFIANAYRVAAPVIENYHSTRDIVLYARPELSERRPLVFYRFFHHTARHYADYQARSQPIHGYEELVDFFRDTPRGEYLVLTKQDGWRDLNAYFHSRLLGRQGEFYLAEVRP